jgi:hypothetical protein
MVRMTSEFMVTLATRDIDGNRLSVDWGDPDQDGFYKPTISVDFEDNPIADLLKALEEIATCKGLCLACRILAEKAKEKAT